MADTVKKEPEFKDPGVGNLQMIFWMPTLDAAVLEMLTKRGHKVVYNPKLWYDVALFTGGPDVHPFLYGEKLHNKTVFDLQRDLRDSAAYHMLHSVVPKVGICRGAQFLNVKSGGRLYQHVTDHAISGTHEVMDNWTSDVFKVTSTHHQMIRPSYDAEILLATDLSKTRSTYDSTIYPAGYSEEDVEACYYPETNSFCFQPHPENDNSPKECTDYFFEKIHTYYWNDTLRRRKYVRDAKKKEV